MGVRELLWQMATTVDAGTVSTDNVQITCASGPYAGTMGISLEEGAYCPDTKLVITFDPALPDADCCQISLDGVSSTHGQPVADSFAVTTLAGDADRDGSVSTADGSAVTQRLGKATVEATAQYDLDTDGFITTADTSVATQRLGRTAPSCP